MSRLHLTDEELRIAISGPEGAMLAGELAIRRALLAKLKSELPDMIVEANGDDFKLAQMVADRVAEFDEVLSDELETLEGKLCELFGVASGTVH
jgi:hypothetical protein